jgi:hypothetical protein
MKTAGMSAINAAPTTMRVRSRAPNALLLWSAYSLSMFLRNSINRTSSTRNTSTTTPVKTSVSPEVSGLRKWTLVVLNALSPTSKPRSASTPQASRAMDRRRGSAKNGMRRL